MTPAAILPVSLIVPSKQHSCPKGRGWAGGFGSVYLRVPWVLIFRYLSYSKKGPNVMYPES